MSRSVCVKERKKKKKASLSFFSLEVKAGEEKKSKYERWKRRSIGSGKTIRREMGEERVKKN